jgi:hypothetical protein
MKMLFQIHPDVLLQVSGITAGRAAALIPGFLGLISLIIGWWALARSSASPKNRRLAAMSAVVLSTICGILSVAHLIRTAGAEFGTGSGRAGAIVALVVSLIGLVLGVAALARLKKSAGDHR